MGQRRIITVISDIEPELEALCLQARSEGIRFMDTLLTKWRDGSNRFDQAGEAYFVISNRERIIAAGGLNRDPYTSDPTVGRVRHVYVEQASRREGAGAMLLAAIIAHARQSFASLRLRTNTSEGAEFYEALGFVRCDDSAASHIMRLCKV